MKQVFDVAILGASGYTGAELVRLIATHPGLRIAAMTADRKAGQTHGRGVSAPAPPGAAGAHHHRRGGFRRASTWRSAPCPTPPPRR